MNSRLQYASREIQRLKQTKTVNGIIQLSLSLDIEYTEDDMKALTGYKAFAQALEQLGNMHDELTIQQACEMSHFNRNSVYFADMEKDDTDNDSIEISVKCTPEQAKKLMFRNGMSHFNSVPIG